MPDIVEVLTRLRDYANTLDVPGDEPLCTLREQLIQDIRGLCDAHESLRTMHANVQDAVEYALSQRDAFNRKAEIAEQRIKDLEAELKAKAGLGIASTAGDSHADLKEKIRQGLIDQD